MHIFLICEYCVVLVHILFAQHSVSEILPWCHMYSDPLLLKAAQCSPVRPWALGLPAPPSNGPADTSTTPTPHRQQGRAPRLTFPFRDCVRISWSRTTSFQTFLFPRPVPVEDLEEARAERTRRKVVWVEAGETRGTQSMPGLYCWPWREFWFLS